MDKVLVVVGAVGLSGLIYWYFLGEKREKEGEVTENAIIKVTGGYSPAVVKVPAGREVTITLTRTDPTDCLEEFLIPDLKIKRSLPMNENVVLKLKVNKGEYLWHCGMNMFHGRLIAV